MKVWTPDSLFIDIQKPARVYYFSSRLRENTIKNGIHFKSCCRCSGVLKAALKVFIHFSIQPTQALIILLITSNNLDPERHTEKMWSVKAGCTAHVLSNTTWCPSVCLCVCVCARVCSLLLVMCVCSLDNTEEQKCVCVGWTYRSHKNA